MLTPTPDIFTALGQSESAGDGQTAQVVRVSTRSLQTDQGTAGRVWVRESDSLRPVDVRLGLSDGTYTELLQDNLEVGTELVTTVTLPGKESAPTTTRSIFSGGRGRF